MRMTNQAKPTIKWLSGLTNYGFRKVWRKEHGYDPLMPSSWNPGRDSEVKKQPWYGEYVG